MPDDPKIEYSQEERLFEIKTTLGEDILLLEKMTGTETISQPFEFQLTLLSPSDQVNLKGLLRTTATITLHLNDGKPRYFNVVFRSLTQAKQGADILTERESMGVSNPSTDLTTYEAVVVPYLWFLSLDADCRIFQEKTVPAIVEQVLKEHGVKDFQFRTQKTYPARDYCVQYRESSLNFISRLLEEEGIFYFFEHSETKHTMIFADGSSMLPVCPGQAVARYSFDDEGWVDGELEGVASLERIEAAHTGKLALSDYNFETPKVSLLATLADADEEIFDYPGEYATKAEGERYARLRLEERESRQFVVNGSSRCRAFRPGYNFKLEGHFRKDTNLDYFLTSVTHEGVDYTYRQEDSTDAFHYHNTFSAIPKTVPYRPPSETERPTVQGLQPALVVGKAGEEIWVDKYGRVKVQFYWDREGKKNESSSCWCRVSQIWAGKNWGWMTIPRMGQEVLVDFLEGDPDQPVIVGRVYNADQMPPYDLPGNQTQSGIKTRSSKGGGTDNFNEIQFEDKKGSEKITVHAEKDMDTVVEHDDDQKIQHNRTITVDGTHTETITGNTTIEIKQGNHSLTLDQGNQSTQLKMGNQSTKLDLGNQTTTVSLGKIDTTAMQSITLTVGGSSIKIDQMGVTIEGMMIKINGQLMTTVQAGVVMTVKGAITLIN